MSYNYLQSGLRWGWISIIIILFDRFTKEFAQDYLSAYSPMAIIPGFNLTLSYNRGAAFSFLDHAAGWQVWFFGIIAVIVSLAILIWLIRLSWKDYWVCIALSFIIGGALGNLWDRIRYGQVIDFIQIYAGSYSWPIFNIADSAVCVGAGMLFLHTLLKK